MENQETYQTENETKIVEVESLTENKKECKTCKKGKVLEKNNVLILGFGITFLFLAFYGLTALVKDITSLFTR